MRVKGKPDALSGADVHIAEHDCPLKDDCKTLSGEPNACLQLHSRSAACIPPTNLGRLRLRQGSALVQALLHCHFPS
jgi:hypothetical protein